MEVPHVRLYRVSPSPIPLHPSDWIGVPHLETEQHSKYMLHGGGLCSLKLILTRMSSSVQTQEVYLPCHVCGMPCWGGGRLSWSSLGRWRKEGRDTLSCFGVPLPLQSSRKGPGTRDWATQHTRRGRDLGPEIAIATALSPNLYTFSISFPLVDLEKLNSPWKGWLFYYFRQLDDRTSLKIEGFTLTKPIHHNGVVYWRNAFAFPDIVLKWIESHPGFSLFYWCIILLYKWSRITPRILPLLLMHHSIVSVQ